MKTQLLIKQNTILIILIVTALVMIGPFIWMISTSLKAFDEVFAYPPHFIPDSWNWENFNNAWNSEPFGRYFFNSIFTTVVIVVLQVITSILAAYAFARLTFKGKNLLFLTVLATMMIPIQVTFIPNFLILSKFGWLNSYLALIVPFSTNAFGIFLIKQAFSQVPTELEEAAKLDGAKHFHIIRYIMVPLSTAAIVTFVLFSVIWHYNDFFWPLIATNNPELRTLQVGISSMISSEGGAQGTQWNLIMAAATFVLLPLIILFIFMQKYIVKGVAKTGLK
ncbi:multiple sugar transport system permease protein [Gracilibacillus ureilyticus]|uniref:Multiple sugar transport system permease protein n=1 Tax=Gracilibacillus ureilyticus TaxID=531814 RepID=A0A1H9TYS6_9BACI|nr:carbohydrate ABC transporter permease [Gracilibacillus ureilyticus]SES02212.1 multiple sugar transport system permease protein [Gracilibacillus ureilyticus]